MLADIVVNAPQTIFYQRPKSVDGLGMGITNDVDALAVIDSAVLIAARPKTLVGTEIVSKDERLGQNVFLGESDQRIGFHIRRDKRPHFALALDHFDDGDFVRFAGRRPTALSAAHLLGSEIALIHLDSTVESTNGAGLLG